MAGEKQQVTLGETQETLLIPLYGRALETRKSQPLLRDPQAVAMVESIDYDFARFDGGPSLFGSVLRTSIFDEWVREFLAAHPAGTVVELGTGLNTRFERVDNGELTWVDLDLPDVIELRKQFFPEVDNRRRVVAASVLDESWVAVVQSCPPPYFFVSEAVLIYLTEEQVRQALGLLAAHFPGSQVAFDTTGSWLIGNQHRHDALKKVTARMQWACDDPRALQQWGLGLQLRESRDFTQLPRPLRSRMRLRNRLLLRVAKLVLRPRIAGYRMNRYDVAAAVTPPQ